MKTALLSILVIFTILGLSVHLYIFSTPLYNHLHEQHGSAQESVQFSEEVIAYFLDGTPLPSELNEHEATHMQDVRTVLQLFFMLYIGSLLFLLFTAHNTGASTLRRPTINGTIAIILTTSLIAITPFEQAFTTFHTLFFKAGTWQFPANSPLIQAYPLQFFNSFATLIAVTAVLISVISLLVCMYSLRTSSTTIILK